jgi:hypothetical protein
MHMLVRAIVSQGHPNGEKLSTRISDLVAGRNFDRLDVAVAYATLSGLEALRTASGGWPALTRWVVGLDDAITQPQALESLVAMQGADLRVCQLGPARRFHPKLYCFWSSNEPANCLAVIGSANMTDHGLNRNGEAAVILDAENEADAEQLKLKWQDFDALGTDASQAILDAYREQHAKARKARRRLTTIGAIPPQPEADEPVLLFDGSPSTASLLFVDFASAMGGGREIELPKVVVPFFGIVDGTPSPQSRNFEFSGQAATPIPLVRRENNGMWRITFNVNVPGSAVLQRPIVDGVQQRSNQAVVFVRTAEGSFRTHFVGIASAEYTALMAETQQAGVCGRTVIGPKGKNYGFR